MVFLLPDHRFRNRHKNQFDGKFENRGPPMIMGPMDCVGSHFAFLSYLYKLPTQVFWNP
jgi:hypothetical protein